MHLVLNRFYQNDVKTLGNLMLFDEMNILCLVKSLELPWKNNQKYISCIPSGNYVVKPHRSPKFGWSLWVQDVPGRSEILIHVANYVQQILGCIITGVMHDDINNDGIMDVKHSGISIEVLRHYLRGETEIPLIINDKT